MSWSSPTPISRSELRELAAFLYYLRYLGEPGDLYRGKILAREKGCLSCHSIAGKGGQEGPAFDELSRYVSPVYMAQALWNHQPPMGEEIRKRGLQRPVFEAGEIVDLSAYIRSASRGVRERLYMSPGNPQKGEKLLLQKGCLDCHSVGARGSRTAPDFAALEWNHSVTEIAGRMWNHADQMGALMEGKKVDWPTFAGSEMADLISYLYFLGFQEPAGDSVNGGRLFQEKGCSQCHGKGGAGGPSAPSLSEVRGLSSPADMAHILWNHAPVMEGRVAEKLIGWPRFEGREMADIYFYIKSKEDLKSGR